MFPIDMVSVYDGVTVRFTDYTTGIVIAVPHSNYHRAVGHESTVWRRCDLGHWKPAPTLKRKLHETVGKLKQTN